MELTAGEAEWELVSSSTEQGVGREELEEEAAALAHSFQLGEPEPDPELPLLAGPAEKRGAVGQPAPGSPQRLERQHLLALPLLPAPLPAAPAAEGQLQHAGGGRDGAAVPASAYAPTTADTPAVAGGAAGGASGLPSPFLVTGQPAPPGPDAEGGSPTISGSGSEDSLCVRLCVVRADQQEALERAVVALEKRASRRERELALARLRLSTAQATAEAESREACKLRRIVLIAGSVCAFLGLRALLREGHASGTSCGSCGLSAACKPGVAAAGVSMDPQGEAARCTGPGLGRLAAAASAADLERLVSVQVEPLPARGPAAGAAARAGF